MFCCVEFELRALLIVHEVMTYRVLFVLNVILAFLTSPCFSQKIRGEWKISEVVTDVAVQ